MNFDMRRLTAMSLVSLAGCVLEEPIGNTPTEGSSDSVGEPPSTAGSCQAEPRMDFTWEWNFGAHEPTFDPGAGLYDYDAPASIECEPSVYVDDPDADTLTLELACSVGGVPVEPQTLSLSPIPAVVLESLEQGEPLSVAFRPEQVCSNGCFVSGRSGWLAIRRSSDGQLLVGIVDVRRLLEPVEELAPLELTAASACAQVPDGDDCETPGWSAPLQVSVSDGDASAEIIGAGTAALGDYEVVLNWAVEGEVDGCTFDAGDRSTVELLILRR